LAKQQTFGKTRANGTVIEAGADYTATGKASPAGKFRLTGMASMPTLMMKLAMTVSPTPPPQGEGANEKGKFCLKVLSARPII